MFSGHLEGTVLWEFRGEGERLSNFGGLWGGECQKCLDTMQDYKSLCVVVMICAILVNTQTHRHLLTGYTIRSAS